MVGLAAGMGYAWWQYDAVTELIDQTRIWPAGIPAVRTEVSGKVTTHKFILHEYKLDVKYRDQKLTEHAGQLTFDTLGTQVDKTADPLVRYLENDPDRFALSWAIEVKTSRWMSIAFMAVAGVGLIGGSFSYLGVMALRRLAEARRCAQRADEVLVRVIKVAPQVVKGSHTGNEYHYEGQTVDGRGFSGKAVFPIKYEPLFAGSDKQLMIALVPPENLRRAVVLRGDFYPYDLTVDEQAGVRAKIASRVSVRSQ